jgi:dihydroorotate dehydrogenase (fumarate)
MADLTTTYMGLSLRNPIIVSSSKLTSTLEDVQTCERAGAGAVVLKSLFEEQILADLGDTAVEDDSMLAHAESMDFFTGMGKNYYMNAYLKLVREAKERVSIPVIASVNCVTAGTWLEYSKSFEDVGADALELNFFVMPADVEQEGSEVEELYLETCRKIKRKVSIPVSMKIGSYFYGLASMVRKLSEEGMDGLVLFNRFYRPDVDIDRFEIISAPVFSSPQEISQSLQWIALLSGEVKCDLAASTGVHDAAGAIKQLLVGARAIQLCSTLYRNGIGYVQKVVKGIEEWMQRHEFERIDDFLGKLSRENIKNPKAYERSQYIRALVGIS